MSVCCVESGGLGNLVVEVLVCLADDSHDLLVGHVLEFVLADLGGCGIPGLLEEVVALSLLGGCCLNLGSGELGGNCDCDTCENQKDDSEEDSDHSAEKCDEVECVECDTQDDCDNGEYVPPLLDAHDEDCECKEEECSEEVVFDTPLSDCGNVVENVDQKDDSENCEGCSGDGDGTFLRGNTCGDRRYGGHE